MSPRLIRRHKQAAIGGLGLLASVLLIAFIVLGHYQPSPFDCRFPPKRSAHIMALLMDITCP